MRRRELKVLENQTTGGSRAHALRWTPPGATKTRRRAFGSSSSALVEVHRSRSGGSCAGPDRMGTRLNFAVCPKPGGSWNCCSLKPLKRKASFSEKERRNVCSASVRLVIDSWSCRSAPSRPSLGTVSARSNSTGSTATAGSAASVLDAGGANGNASRGDSGKAAAAAAGEAAAGEAATGEAVAGEAAAGEEAVQGDGGDDGAAEPPRKAPTLDRAV
mmetsp:Transcript_40600/g.127450  ORF Transcript_40600/g.127450 Transcript_40600/m.127450 type:complete len:217 (-) Transcript_40600:181-831(-)